MGFFLKLDLFLYCKFYGPSAWTCGLEHQAAHGRPATGSSQRAHQSGTHRALGPQKLVAKDLSGEGNREMYVDKYMFIADERNLCSSGNR
jgi:hypothetical protein